MLLGFFDRAADEKKPIDVFAAWRSLTMDIITTFAFGVSMDGLTKPNLDHYMLDTLMSAVSATYVVCRQLPTHELDAWLTLYTRLLEFQGQEHWQDSNPSAHILASSTKVLHRRRPLKW